MLFWFFFSWIKMGKFNKLDFEAVLDFLFLSLSLLLSDVIIMNKLSIAWECMHACSKKGTEKWQDHYGHYFPWTYKKLLVCALTEQWVVKPHHIYCKKPFLGLFSAVESNHCWKGFCVKKPFVPNERMRWGRQRWEREKSSE
jgi:hypothetical protein